MADKDTTKINRMLSGEYIEMVKKVSQRILEENLQDKAFELLNLFKKVLADNKNELDGYKDIHSFYKEVIVKLSFVSLPVLDDEEVVGLMGNYFTRQFGIPNYDLLGKFKAKLINAEIFENRDKLKDGIKKVLLNNKEVITGKAEIRTISDWLRDYNSKLGIGAADKLKKSQYLVDLKKNKGLDEQDLEKLKTLFNFYEGLKLSSLTPQGFEEEPSVVVNNKLYIFRQGTLEAVEGKIKEVEPLKAIDGYGVKITELKDMLSQYPEGSLERKAIEEEIAKLKTGGGDKKVE